MSLIKVLGIDLGKSTFHIIGHDYAGREQLRRKFNRKQLLQFLATHEPVSGEVSLPSNIIKSHPTIRFNNYNLY